MDEVASDSLNKELTAGLRYGYRGALNPVSPGNAPPHVAEQGFNVLCERCNTPYRIQRLRPDRASRRLCRKCRSVVGITTARENHPHVVPESTREERIRAQGLVNKRLRLGWFKKPKRCVKCNNPHRRITGHHQDYSKPDEVHWICPKCHRHVHLDASFLDGIPPFKCERIDLGLRTYHSKGGKCGPRLDRKGRSPLAMIRCATVADGKVIESLSCGHQFIRDEDGKRPIQRRCQKCRCAFASPETLEPSHA